MAHILTDPQQHQCEACGQPLPRFTTEPSAPLTTPPGIRRIDPDAEAARLTRRRYPNTAMAVLYVAAAVAMLCFPPVRKTGELMLGLLAIAVAVVVMEHVSRPRR